MKIKNMTLGLLLTNTVLSYSLSPKVNDIFHEYDIRGIVGEQFNPEDTYHIAQAIGSYFRSKNPAVKKIALGMDGRTHSEAIKQQITRGLLDSGFDVIFVGTCTTPVLYFSLHQLAVDGGLMITASHNPAEYNGIKICLGKQSVFGPELKKIRDQFLSSDIILSSESGTYSEIDMITPYVDWLAKEFSHLKGFALHALIDCGNGAGGTVMPYLIKKMEWPQVKLLYAEVDGTYPHHVADPTVEKYMHDLKKAVAESDAIVGMGLDGDADRMAAVTKAGKLVTGDRLLSIFAKPLVQKYLGAAIVFDVSSSGALAQLLRSWGAEPVLSKTGIGHIKNRMTESGSLLGGETSCHFVFKDRYFGYDDGIYAALRLIEQIHQTGSTLEELLADFPPMISSPLYRIPCGHSVRLAVVEALKLEFSSRSDFQLTTVDGVRIDCQYGWGIVRLSSTEPLLSIRFEGTSQADLQKIKDEFAAVMIKHMDCSFLK